MGTVSFIDAYRDAELTHPRRYDEWLDAPPRPDNEGWDISREAAGRAVMQEPDRERAWDRAFGAAQEAAPDYWTTTLDNLRAAFAEDELDRAWVRARARMAELHPQAHRSAGLAASAEPAGFTGAAAAMLAEEREGADAVAEVLWRDVEELVTRLTVRPDD